MTLDLDALDPAGLGAARALCTTGRSSELFERARSGNAGGTVECRARVAIDATGVVAGIALAGPVAGALGTGALLWLAVHPDRRRRGVGRALLDDALAELARAGARLVVCEMPADAAGASLIALLDQAGFEREGFIPDFYRDGVGLILWSRPLR